MAGLYWDEITDPALRALPKYAIGDRMRVVKVKYTDIDNYLPDTQEAFRVVLGRVLSIKEIILWETTDPDKPYLVTYTFYIAHLTGSPNRRSYEESIYLEDDEIEPIKKRVSKKSDSSK